jgi:hypothetical protein
MPHLFLILEAALDLIVVDIVKFSTPKADKKSGHTPDTDCLFLPTNHHRTHKNFVCPG